MTEIIIDEKNLFHYDFKIKINKNFFPFKIDILLCKIIINILFPIIKWIIFNKRTPLFKIISNHQTSKNKPVDTLIY